MAESISRLKLESGEFDAKIKRATQGLLQMEQECRKVNGTLAVLEKDQLQYVKSLGSMQTVSTTVRGKLRELTQAYTELSVQYKRLTDEEKKGDFGKALSASLDQIKGRINETKQQLAEVGEELGNVSKKSGMFGGGKLDGMLQVLGGNLMTKAVTTLGSLATGMGDIVKEGIEMARQGEGIRNAFDRLNRPDLLDKLREATHGTVTDLELMKQAVKFNDFNLSLDEMGTMLAFAQQKAKDTGQSVDYMVDSIVTGLGRQSLMILDNLGLSASEIKERMKSTGDMTKAVGSIIRDQMQAAGGYIETAADRATAADVELKNAMEDLGRTFQPLAEAGSSMFNSLATAAINALNKMRPFFDQFTEAGRIRQQMEKRGGVGGDISKLKAAKASGSEYYTSYLYKNTIKGYDEQINKLNFSISANSGDKDSMGKGRVQKLKEELQAVKNLKAAYIEQANAVLNPVVKTATGGVTTPKTTKEKKTVKEDKDDFVEITGLINNAQERVNDLRRQINEAPDENMITALRDQLKEAQAELDRLNGKTTEFTQGLSGFNSETMNAWMSGRQKDLSGAEFGSDEFNNISSNIVDMNSLKSLMETAVQNGIDTAQFNLAPLWEKIFDGENIDDSVWESLTTTINGKLAELGVEPIKLNVDTGTVEKVKKEGKETSESWKGAASSIGNVGSALSSLKDPGLNAAGIVAQAVANIALGFATATASPATSAAGVFGWIAAVVGGLATMMSTIDSIHSSTGFAQGGIVPGNNLSGDNLNGASFGINSGELILNKAQQGNLASQLSGGGMQNMRLETYVDARALRIVLNNDSVSRGKGKYVTSKNQ